MRRWCWGWGINSGRAHWNQSAFSPTWRSHPVKENSLGWLLTYSFDQTRSTWTQNSFQLIWLKTWIHSVLRNVRSFSFSVRILSQFAVVNKELLQRGKVSHGTEYQVKPWCIFILPLKIVTFYSSVLCLLFAMVITIFLLCHFLIYHPLIHIKDKARCHIFSPSLRSSQCLSPGACSGPLPPSPPAYLY